MTFYGIPEDDLKKVYEAIIEIGDLYKNHGRSIYAGDNLFALMRNLSFYRDAKFTGAFDKNDADESERHKMWRLHTYCWAGRSALSVPGDFVECGVYQGFYSAVLTHFLGFESIAKELYLYDTFAGLSQDWSTETERDILNPNFDWDGTHEAVIKRFASYPNVHVIEGVVPEIFAERAPETIALLHVDLNAAAAEVAALDHLYDRISDGGIILMDDYGREENQLLHLKLQDWWRERNHAVLELPTGQGLVIKRG
jgi:hypothetical protein